MRARTWFLGGAVLSILIVASPALAQGTISTVSPNTAVAGTSNLTVSFTLTSPPPVPPAGETPAAKDCIVTFTSPAVFYRKTGGFTVTSPPNTPPSITAQPASRTAAVGESVTFAVGAAGSPTLAYHWQKNHVDIEGATEASYSIAGVTTAHAGNYRCVVTNAFGSAASDDATLTVDTSVPVVKASYPVVDTAQTSCYNASTSVTCPGAGQSFHGQDGQVQGYEPRFTTSVDGLTVHDEVSGLTWQHTPDSNGDGTINASDKLTLAQAQARPAALNGLHYGGFGDWRLPTIKELYSLMDFRGTDPSGLSGSDTSGLIPFIDRTYFDFAYGDTSAGERIIDSQYASSTLYVASSTKLFGVNFADGRIKGYDLTMPGGSSKTFFVMCVRGNTSYGVNAFVDNGDQTITDRATGLMWPKSDSGVGMNWQDALAFAQTKNAANDLGYGDWRLPNVKELQSLLDDTRSPDTSGSAAINPLFNATSFTGETCSTEYPWYWSSTTHAQYNGSAAAGAYMCFGRSTGYMGGWVDVHGAGAQRSDPKGGSLGSWSYAACGYYNSIAPQGDSVRIVNYVRLVRGGNGPLRDAFTSTPPSPTDATPVSFTASASGGTSPYSYAWDLGGTPASGAVVARTFAPGTHTVTLSVTDAVGLVTTISHDLTVTATVSAPPPVADGDHAGATATFAKSPTIPGQIDVTYDASACIGQKAVILHGSLGNFSTYQGCAQSNAGAAGTAVIDASSLDDVGFNIVWTNGSTAGHPGYAFEATADVARTWGATGFCGVTADDQTQGACP